MKKINLKDLKVGEIYFYAFDINSYPAKCYIRYRNKTEVGDTHICDLVYTEDKFIQDMFDEKGYLQFTLRRGTFRKATDKELRELTIMCI